MSIPKKIHYCWFGKQPFPPLVEKCINTWKDHFKGYEFILWNEDNSDMDSQFVKEAYKKELWAFVSDYIRLKVLYEHGGIYLDTDMYAVKNIDSLLHNKCIFGSESPHMISCGVIGVEKNNTLIERTLNKYDNLKIPPHYDVWRIAIPILITETFRELYDYNGNFKNEVNMDDIVIYPRNYFYPFPNDSTIDQDFHKYLEEDTYMVHLWSKSWKKISEFRLIKRKQYFPAFKMIIKMIIKHRIVSLTYYKKIIRTFLRTIKN